MQYPIILLLLLFYFKISAEAHLPILVEGREWVTKITYLDGMYSTSTTPVIYLLDGDTIMRDGTLGKKLIWKNGPYLHTTDYALIEDNGRLELVDNHGTSTLQMDLSVESEQAYQERGFKRDFCDLVDNSHKRLYNPGDSRVVFIDGIGPTLNPFYHRNPDKPIPTDGKYDFLQAVWDNGRLIGKREDFLRGIENDDMRTHWISMIRNDRTWIYGGFDEDGSYYLSYWRFGESARVFGLVYTYAYEYKRVNYPDITYPEHLQELTPGITMPAVWVHEDAGQIATLSPSFNRDETLEELALRTDYMNQSFLFLDYYCNILGNPEYFASYLQKDETGKWNYGHYFQMEDILEMEPILIDGETRQRYALRSSLNDPDPIVCIEGIGALSHAFLPYILRPDRYPIEQTPRLIYYCDGEGNVIHKFADLPWEESGVTAPGLSDRPAKSRLTDLFGRSVANPVAGSIYIRDGKKILWQ